MYKIMIIEDDKGIAEGIGNQIALWNMDAYIIKDFRNVLAEFTHLILST